MLLFVPIWHFCEQVIYIHITVESLLSPLQVGENAELLCAMTMTETSVYSVALSQGTHFWHKLVSASLQTQMASAKTKEGSLLLVLF